MTPRKRRQYGSGSVFRRSSDGRWLGVLQAGFKPDGRRRVVTVSAPTEAECKRKLDRKRRQLETDGLPSAGRGRATVKSWGEEWLEHVVAKQRPKSYTATRSAVQVWIVPTIGHRRLEDLSPGDVRAVVDAQRKAGRSPATRVRTHTVLMQMLKAAIVEGHSIPQRVLLVERPSVGSSDREALPTQDAIRLLELAGELPHGSRWLAALLQGMRQMECLGLTWAAVDLDRGLLDISWQLQALPYLDRKAGTFRVPDHYEIRQLEGRWHLVRPKTSRGYRLIPLVPPMLRALEAWRERCPESPHGLVWPALDGSPADDKADLDEWKALQGSAGIGHPAGRYYVLHEARHTTATLLLEAGVDPEVVKSILGHSSVVTSQGYQHASRQVQAEALSRVAGLLELR